MPVFADYARYLSATFAHCRFVERHFPQTNRTAAPGSTDFHCKPNSIRELFAIIHQLYVLKSWGVEGDFADTFRDWRPPRLMCLWVDVDLEVSARDLMVVADQLSPEATLSQPRVHSSHIPERVDRYDSVA